MNKQRGAVLIIALIFMLLITAIAASLMTSGSFETAMVTNKQKRKDDFHATEAGNESLLRQKAVFNAARNGNGAAANVTALLPALPANSGMVRTAAAEILPGMSLTPEGQSLSGGAKYELFEIRSTVTTADSQTEHVIGIARIKGSGGVGSPYDP